jgi:4-diphosphocytidyl-2-C-methyl-D-erythritol kinase
MQIVEEIVRAPAKVNLYLHILGRRADGYHLLDSLMVPVSLYDELRVRVSASETTSTIAVGSNSAALPCGPTNLAHRAAALFLETTRRTAAVDISLTKRIPIGSGLGGGSSDAAAVLLALNRLLGCPFNPAELASLAGQLGADVTFFAYGRPARVGGIGEHVVPVDLPTLPLVICTDGYALSTRQVYSRVDLASLTSHEPVTNISELVGGRRPISKWLTNDLETAAAGVHPEVLSLKAKLVEQGALGALMTGSGSAVFGVWPDPQLARDAATRLRQQGLWAESVVTVNRSPAVGN